MTKILRTLAVIAALFTVAAPAYADGATGSTPTQQVAQRLDAATLSSNTSGTAQQTLTITPPSGYYVYFTAIEIISCAPTAPAASALTHTTTNLAGRKFFGGLTATGGVCDKVTYYPGTAPLKSSQPGLAVTIVSNAAITNVTYNIVADYYFAQ